MKRYVAERHINEYVECILYYAARLYAKWMSLPSSLEDALECSLLKWDKMDTIVEPRSSHLVLPILGMMSMLDLYFPYVIWGQVFLNLVLISVTLT